MSEELTPITREETILSGESLTPITRLEKIFAGEDLEPITRLEYFAKNAQGDGNPNTTQTITGTLDDPWGSVDLAELVTALGSNGATVTLTMDASALSAGTYMSDILLRSNKLDFSFAQLTFGTGGAVNVSWDASTGALTLCKVLRDDVVSDLTDYASSVTTSAVIVWHPLPEG